MTKEKKYRLLKDLPQIKAGAIFELEKTVTEEVYIPGDCCIWMIGNEERRAYNPKFNAEEMPYLVREGWFEEVEEKDFNSNKQIRMFCEDYRKIACNQTVIHIQPELLDSIVNTIQERTRANERSMLYTENNMKDFAEYCRNQGFVTRDLPKMLLNWRESHA